MSHEPGARSQEPGARSQEPGARSQESATNNRARMPAVLGDTAKRSAHGDLRREPATN